MGSRDKHCSSEYVRPDARPNRTAPAGVAARMVMQRLSGSSESESMKRKQVAALHSPMHSTVSGLVRVRVIGLGLVRVS
tara:strand:- start:76 stop:312 length:237 start_codon:yes stop_codon:yes gene_type:complete